MGRLWRDRVIIENVTDQDYEQQIEVFASSRFEGKCSMSVRSHDPWGRIAFIQLWLDADERKRLIDVLQEDY